MSDYRVEVKVKNNNLLRKIEEAGYSSVGEFCRLNGNMNWASHIGELVNLKRSPLTHRGEFISIVHKICDLLMCLPEELFSEVQLTTALESNKRTMQVNEAEMRFMLENQSETLSLESQIHHDRLPGKINEIMETLTPREAKVISMRFGLGEYEEAHMHHEIAKELEVSSNRVAQIEQKIMRKLRHPSRSYELREGYIED